MIATLQQTASTLRKTFTEAQAQQRVTAAYTVELQAALERVAAEARQAQERQAEQPHRLGKLGGELAAMRRQVEEQAVLINRFALTQSERQRQDGETGRKNAG